LQNYIGIERESKKSKNIEIGHTGMALVRTSVILFICQIIALFMGIISDIIVSRTLGASGRGNFYLIVTTYTLLVGIMIFGMSYAGTYMLAKNKARIAEVHTAVIIFICGITTVACIALWLIVHCIPSKLGEQIRPNLAILFAMIPIELYRQCWTGLMVGLNRVLPMIKITLFLTGVYLFMIAIFLGLLKMGLRGALIAIIFNGFLSVAFMFWGIIKQNEGYFSLAKPKLIIEMLKYGSIAHVGNAAVQLYQRMGVYFLTWMGSMAEVGYYTLSLTMAEKQLLVLGAINTATNYRIIGDEKQSSELLMASMIRISLAILIIVCTVAIICSRWVVQLLYGQNYLTVVKLLIIAFPGTAFLGLASTLSNYFMGQLGKPSITSGLSVIFLIICIPVYYIMVSHYGMIGAAGTISLIYFFHFLVLIYLFVKMTRLSFKDALVVKKTDLKRMWDFIINNELSFKSVLLYQRGKTK
jgi:O-antigen/teichoic acid export membrane protein